METVDSTTGWCQLPAGVMCGFAIDDSGLQCNVCGETRAGLVDCWGLRDIGYPDFSLGHPAASHSLHTA